MVELARAMWITARNTVLFGALCVVTTIVVVQAAQPVPEPAPAATVTERSVRQLTRALEAATAVSVPPAVQPEVTEAEEVIEAVETGEVRVVPTPTVPPVAVPTTTTARPTTTTTVAETIPHYEWPQ